MLMVSSETKWWSRKVCGERSKVCAKAVKVCGEFEKVCVNRKVCAVNFWGKHKLSKDHRLRSVYGVCVVKMKVCGA
jgi:hypothetical protein